MVCSRRGASLLIFWVGDPPASRATRGERPPPFGGCGDRHARRLAIPLVLMMVFLVQKGWGLLSVHLFSKDLKGVGPLSPPGSGGLAMAIVGTLEQVGLAIALGRSRRHHHRDLLERGRGPLHLDGANGGHRDERAARRSWPASSSTRSGSSTFGFGFSGLAGSFAIAIMLLPSITRTTEEVLKVVPGGLREAALALGAPQWRTVWSVVLPTARTGIITAVVLGVARAVGETAPLLFTIFGNNFVNANPFHGPQSSLTLFLFQKLKSS